MYFRCIYHFLLALTLEFTFLYPALAQENTPNAQDLRNELPYQLMDVRIKEAVQHAKALIQLDRNSFLDFYMRILLMLLPRKVLVKLNL